MTRDPGAPRGAIRAALLAFLLYLALAVLLFGRGLVRNPAAYYLGQNSTDPSIYMWCLVWWPYALIHRLDPLFTHLIWAPGGTTLTWMSPIPLPAIVFDPITGLLGPVAAYNVLCIVAVALASLSAYLLCRRIAGAFWPAIVGGFIFGFSPFMAAQMLAHGCLLLAFPIPLAVLLALRRHGGEISAARYAIGLAAVLVVQFLCFAEFAATMTVFAGVAFVIALATVEERDKLLALILPTAVAYALAGAILSPYAYEMFVTRPPGRSIYPLSAYSADLLNFIVPTRASLLGTLPWARDISRRFNGPIEEQGAYLTLPLIVIAEAWRRRNWHTPEGKILTLTALLACVAAIGPIMHVAGVATFPMPWMLAARLPILAIALPVRFVLYAFLALAIIASLWFASPSAGFGAKLLAVGALVLFLLPNPSADFWISRVDTPAFFRAGASRATLRPDDIILPLPYGRMGTSMLWQATAGMSFRMASGYTSVTPFRFQRFPIFGFFSGATDLPEAGEQLKAFIASKHVSAIVAALDDPNLGAWTPALDALGIAPIEQDGVRLYRIPAGRFEAYASLAPAELEARAVALRFDILTEAAADFLARGGRVKDISAGALRTAHLLPPDWTLAVGRYTSPDYFVIPVGDRVAIAMGGSYDALRPLAERYGHSAIGIDYPYPRRWLPGRDYPRNSMQPPMVFLFDRAGLERAAAALRSTPPPERAATIFPRQPSGSSRTSAN